MDAMILLMIAVISGIFSFPFLLEGIYKIAFPLLFICLTSLCLFALSFIFPYQIEYLKDLKIYDVDGIKCVSYDKGDGNIQTVNLNKKFSKQISSEKVRLTKYKSGPYLWLYFDGFITSERNQYKLELIPSGSGVENK